MITPHIIESPFLLLSGCVLRYLLNLCTFEIVINALHTHLLRMQTTSDKGTSINVLRQISLVFAMLI